MNEIVAVHVMLARKLHAGTDMKKPTLAGCSGSIGAASSIDSYTCHSPVSAATARPPLWVHRINDAVITMLAIVGMAFQDLATGWLGQGTRYR